MNLSRTSSLKSSSKKTEQDWQKTGRSSTLVFEVQVRQKIRFWWVSRMEMNAMLPSLHSPVSGSQGGGETRDQGRSRGTKSRNLPGGKTRSCAKIANKVRALMARVGSLINCFHIIHLYSRKITLFLGQQWLGFHKKFPGWNESLHLRFLRLWEDVERGYWILGQTPGGRDTVET